MHAFRLLAQGPALVTDAPVPEPREGQVLLKIAGSGACHSDLHVFEATKAGTSWFAPPFTIGHENTGWIEAVGAGVRDLRAGEAVAVYCAWGCGRCRACLISSENYCESTAVLRGGGLGEDGGMANYMLVPAAKYLVPLGELEPRDAAPLSDAGLTPYHAVKRSLSLLTPDATAIVLGAGGLGHMAIQILRALTSAQIVALDIDDAKLARARELGADITFRSDDTARDAIKQHLSGRQADIVFDFVGLQATIDLGRKLVRPDGDFSIVGLGGGTMSYAQGKIAWGARVSTPFYGSIAELREVIALAQRGRIHAHVTRYPLERAAEAYQALHDGSLDGRAVICPNG
ncbi:MAG TPA: NAD(P)-dependent alcohol dehydrogenase [Candidatus Baltobacteraceae bacterium]|nr:NAD(P)-dependent alcohol dehydrogenase [Candidatus Baltobacteraceae bacterium]